MVIKVGIGGHVTVRRTRKNARQPKRPTTLTGTGVAGYKRGGVLMVRIPGRKRVEAMRITSVRSS